MRTPQTEDGYTRIANELLEAFSTLDASGSAWRVFMVVLRKTYGFHKKEDAISLTQFESMSKLNHRSVCRGLNELIQSRIIEVRKNGYINVYRVQKDYSLWGSDKNDTVKPVTESSDRNDTGSSVKLVTNKRYKDIKILGDSKESQKLPTNSKKDMGWTPKQSDNDDDLDVIDIETGEPEKPKEKVVRHYKEVYEVFKHFGMYSLDWTKNRTEQKAGDDLYTEKGIEQIEKALRLYKENKDKEFCPLIYSPSTLIRKWKSLLEFKKKQEHG